jgi:hypothetical protein
VAPCAIQQLNTPSGTTTALCGELVITAGNGKQSIDTVTVTVGGKAPTRVSTGQTIQSVIDAAAPGDLIIVPPGNFTEMLLMWKPLRLQGVGAASTVINANTHPASEAKLGAWRRQVTCLFGLALNGRPITTTGANPNPYDPNGQFTCTPDMYFKVDRLPLEATVGWDATLNGNLAEQLQEPTLMGAYEGAVITVLSKGVDFHGGDPFAADTFPTGTTLLGTSTHDCTGSFTSNFLCNPSRIDGLSLTNSSQGGGGVFVHAWGHELEISNNRIYNNQGTLSGGIQVGQGEHPTAYLGGTGVVNADPGSCQTSNVANLQLPYCFDRDVKVHHNSVTLNSSTGDELFSATPAGAGGVTFCSGADNYLFNYNWLCGNLSTGDGGGFAHLGFAPGGHIEHNSILFNETTNPTVATNGGGIQIMGAPDIDPTCPGPPDTDCGIGLGLGDGTGNITINANLIMGNAAEAGSGGGIRLQGINGTDAQTFPTNPSRWYKVDITNNIITNNVAGWDGAGVSLNDALVVNFINNTVISNDSTASSGVLFGAFFAPQSSDPNTPPCTNNCGNNSAPLAAGLVATGNSPGLVAALPATTVCPAGHTNCRSISNPLLDNNVFWQNRAFHITVGALGGGTTSQQAVVTLVPTLNQTATGACATAPQTPSYWDIGVRGDTGPGNHASGFQLSPRYSVMTSATEFGLGSNDVTGNPNVVRQYCNGARTPPEFGGSGYLTPPGTFEGNGSPLPVFNLTAGATVDEGNNWINISWGPLALTNPVTGTVLGNYSLTAASTSAIGRIPSVAPTYTEAPSVDFFGTPRKTNNAVDAGAVEFVAPSIAIANVTGGPLVFGNVRVSATSPTQTLTLHNVGGANLTGIALTFTGPFSRPAGAAGGTCTATLTPAAGTCTINVVFQPTATGAATGTLAIAASVGVTGAPVGLSGTGVPAILSASVTPSPLAFGNWASGTTSSALTLTVTNTGNTALAGGTFTFGGGAPQPFSRAGGTCGAALGVAGTCTINVVFAPATATAFSRTLTVAYTGATVTPTPVTLTGTGVASRATLSVTPSPLTITLPTGAANVTGTGVVTLTNTAAAGGSQVVVSNVTVAGGNLLTYFFNVGALAGPNTCTNATLAPGGTCTVTVRFTNTGSPRGADRAGTITFTDTGLASPQVSNLVGHANP